MKAGNAAEPAKTLTPQFVRDKVHAYCQTSETPNISISPVFTEATKQLREAAK